MFQNLLDEQNLVQKDDVIVLNFFFLINVLYTLFFDKYNFILYFSPFAKNGTQNNINSRYFKKSYNYNCSSTLHKPYKVSESLFLGFLFQVCSLLTVKIIFSDLFLSLILSYFLFNLGCLVSFSEIEFHMGIC